MTSMNISQDRSATPVRHDGMLLGYVVSPRHANYASAYVLLHDRLWHLRDYYSPSKRYEAEVAIREYHAS